MFIIRVGRKGGETLTIEGVSGFSIWREEAGFMGENWSPSEPGDELVSKDVRKGVLLLVDDQGLVAIDVDDPHDQ